MFERDEMPYLQDVPPLVSTQSQASGGSDEGAPLASNIQDMADILSDPQVGFGSDQADAAADLIGSLGEANDKSFAEIIGGLQQAQPSAGSIDALLNSLPA
jgi:hypothetical protein